MDVSKHLIAMVLAIAAAAPAAAADIVDQQQTVSTTRYYLGTRSGQSFTPTLSGIDYATIQLAGTSSVRIDLYAGDGFGGSIIGSTGVMNVSGDALTPYTFRFPTQVALTPGSIYTLRFEGSATYGYGTSLDVDSYAGGRRWNTSGLEGTDDAYFVEGISSVPEPATWAAMTLGLGVAGASLRRRRRRGAARA